MNKISTILIIVILSLVVACSNHQKNYEQEEVKLNSAYDAWVQTVNDKDLDSWSTYLASDARFFPPDSPALTTREEILNYYRELFSDPLFSLQCEQMYVEISPSGNVAWTYGECESTFSGNEGEKAHGSSKWIKVWKKQKSGKWKCSVNIWNSRAPILSN